MADLPYWKERIVTRGDLRILVLRYRRRSPGKPDRWILEAWMRAPLGEGTYYHRGTWCWRPSEEVAKRAIHEAFPKARGEWTGTELVEAEGT